MNSNNIAFHPIISSIQKVALYDTKTKLYLIGSNNTQTRFRVLQIDRREHTELNITDDKIEYGPREIRDLVNTIEITNRARGGTVKVVSAFGIVGFVRFLAGYYVVLITARRRVAIIGLHTLYKIEDTCMVPISTDTRAPHPHEQRYVKMFQNIDLSSNFYFSYSYDLTRSLQNNLAPPRFICAKNTDAGKANGEDIEIPEPPPLFDTSPNRKVPKEREEYGVRNNPLMRYVWNAHLLKDVESLLHPDWLLYITHGFVDQSNMSIFGRPVYVTIIARRSSKFAGTRFLKRGANFSGDVANEVETEQLVHDSGTVSALSEGRFSSFVQMRGSIPGHWSQDISKMVPKPPIGLDLADAYGQTAGAHFNRLLGHYGSPIIILNLVKKSEKKRHESILTEEFRRSVKYLNQFLPPQHRIHYIHFDMARKSRRKQGDVMGSLASIAKNAVAQTGIFYSGGFKSKTGSQLQTGVIRVNCVDCLDRTNTAQFAIGKCVLGYQLCALGFLDSPELEFDSDCVRMLEGLYEDHGDTLALQYGGSQLVHRIKTYRKTAPWTSQGNDIMQTLSRYYSNTFSDNEKQNTINLFLGYFIAAENKPAIWEISTDFYMHNPIPKHLFAKTRKPKTQWWDTAVLKHLPHAFNDFNKSVSEMIRVHSRDVAMIDIYADYFRPHELTILADMFAYTISHSVRDFMPNFTTDFSPFIVRVRPGRRREGGAAGAKNPSLTGQSSTGSTASSSSSNVDSDSSSDDDGILESMVFPEEPERELCSFSSLLPSMASVYGTEPKQPSDKDLQMYKRYVQINRKATPKQHINALTLKTDSFDEQIMNFKSLPSLAILPNSRNTSSIVITPNPDIPNDTVENVTPPTVPQKSIDIYTRYVQAGVEGGVKTSPGDLKIYEKYISMLGNSGSSNRFIYDSSQTTCLS